MRPLEKNEALGWNGLTVTTFEWEHRIVDTAKMFAARLEANAMVSGLYFANPYDALRSHSLAEFVAAVRGAAPTVEVEAVEPGPHIPLRATRGMSAVPGLSAGGGTERR